MGTSSVDGYIRALLGGCRSVEMDIYDGPVAGHGPGINVTMSNALSTEIGELSKEMVGEASAISTEVAAEAEKAMGVVATEEVKVDLGTVTEELKVAAVTSGVILGEPIVTHGGTLTSSLPVRRICEAIDRYGFVSSQYPIIISGEIHCGGCCALVGFKMPLSY